MNRGFSIGRIRGIEVILDGSLLIIFFCLGAGLFSAWHPDWGGAPIWLSAVTAAVLSPRCLMVRRAFHEEL